MTLQASDRRKRLERYGRLYGEHRLAIAFTAGVAGDDAKRCTTAGWDKTRPLADGGFGAAYVRERGERRNPVIVVRPSNLVSLECDGPDELGMVDELGLPPTVTVRSSGPAKLHFHFRPPADLATLPYVAFRFESGRVSADETRYFVCPPALHPTGVAYEFVAGLGIEDVGFAELPADVYRDLCARARRATSQTRAQLSVDAGAKFRHGDRGRALFRFACLLRRWYADDYDAILDATLRYNEQRCEPPIERQRVEQQVRGAMKKNSGQELAAAGARDERRLARLSEHALEEAEFVDRPLLQVAFTLFTGRPGVGKGALCAHWVARCTNGSMYGTPRNAVWLSSEDDPGMDLGPRVEVAGGDRERVFLIPHTFQLPGDVDWLRATVRELGDVGLLVIDPLGNHTGAANTDRESDVRHALMPLAVLANELRIPLLGVRHISSKESSGGALRKILGSTAWIGVPRVVLVAARDTTDETLLHVHAIKGNRVPPGESGRSFRTSATRIQGDGAVRRAGGGQHRRRRPAARRNEDDVGERHRARADPRPARRDGRRPRVRRSRRAGRHRNRVCCPNGTERSRRVA